MGLFMPSAIARLLATVFLLAATTAALAQTAATPAVTDDWIVAKVNGMELRHSDVVASAEGLPEAYRQQVDALFPPLLERLIDLNLLVSEGRRQSLDADPVVRAQIAKYQEQVIREALINRYLAGKIGEETVRARYKRFIKETPPQLEVRARHILLDSEAAAKDIIAQLEAGASFADLAGQQTIDTASAAKAGDLGYFTGDQMVPEFSEAAFALDRGEYTKQPVKTRFGWHVILVEDRRERPRPSFEEARAKIEEQLSQELVSALLADLRQTATIEKFNRDGTPMLSPVTEEPPAADAPAPVEPAPVPEPVPEGAPSQP